MTLLMKSVRNFAVRETFEKWLAAAQKIFFASAMFLSQDD